MAEVVRLSFEGSEIVLALPEGWRVAGTWRPREVAPLADVEGALRAALDAPIGRAPLGPGELAGKRVLLVVDDVSRPTPAHRFFGVVLDWLVAHGASLADAFLVPALGIHRDMTPAEMAAKVGAHNLARLAWENHRPRDREAHVDLGTTSRGTPVLLNRRLAEADLVVCVGAIEPHLLQGFGGGLKMLLPGLAHADTIQANHLVGASWQKFNYVGTPPEQSPMRLDLEEAVARLGKPVFVVNAVLTERLQLHRFVCGDPIAAHREGVRTAAGIFACDVPQPADVAIVTSDPMNADLRQGMKCIGNVEPALKEGGLVLSLLACRNGVGDVALPPKALPNKWLRRILRLIGAKRVLGFVDRVKKGAGVEERFMAHFSMQVVRKLQLVTWSPHLPADTGAKLGLFVQVGSPQELIEIGRRFAPKNATVHVFPHGGVTYPAPR